jgi:hypothetical protein
MNLTRKALVIGTAAIIMLGGGTAALAAIHPPAAASSSGSASAVISMAQYEPDNAPEVSPTAWGFLGSPPEQHFLNRHTASEITGTVSENPVEGGIPTGTLGICYEGSGGSSLTDVSQVSYQFLTDDNQNDVFPETVSGVVGNLPAGEYYVGLCAEDQGYTSNEAASVTIIMTETRSGVSYSSLANHGR